METERGRLVKISGDDYIEQLVMIGLIGGYSRNPFQDMGLGDFMIFEINDAQTEGEIRTAIESLFEILEKDQLAKLDNPSKDVKLVREDSNEGKMYAEITYVNMETQERQEIEVPVPPAGES